ncbi:MAG: XTP/dITP diphosphohydrolase, partial [Bacteroidota bacterium]|nr:XTP/dITP diphosphohydrolase [Bacteroidota bacterium]
MQILLASNNRHKQREMQQILNSRLPGFLDLVTPEDLRYEPLNVVEDGLTLEENAQKKAEAYFNYTKIQCIADDTGLEIDALDGQPGVFSARFAGEQGNDAANRSKILELMKNIPSEERTAQFRTIICLKCEGVLE